MKQAIVEALAANDMDVERGGLYEQQLKHLNFVAWTNLMQQCMKRLTALLNRIRAIHDIQLHVVTMENGRQEEVLLILLMIKNVIIFLLTLLIFFCSFKVVISDEDRQRLQQSLREMLQSICDSAHEQCGRLLASRTKDGALLERVSSQEFVALAQLIEKFVNDCQQISGHRALGLRLAFQV